MDKTDQILDIIENPDKYSRAEVEELLHDPEAKKILDLFDKIKGSLHSIPSPDVDHEWEKFKNELQRLTKEKSTKKFFFRPLSEFFSRKVAAIIIITIVSISAVAAFIGISVNYLIPKDHKSETPDIEKETYVAVNQTECVKDTLEVNKIPEEIIIFDNETLDSIMTQIGVYYGYKIEFKNDVIKSLRLYYRWKQATTIEEVIESLNNFEQIHLAFEDKTIKID